jgi:hypothetical protein
MIITAAALSIIMTSSDLKLAGTLLDDLQSRIYLAAGIRLGANDIKGAEEFLASLSGADSVRHLQ